MTLNEFKAWFEGYTEGLEAAPTKAQFDRIKERVKEIADAAPTSYPIFIDRYWREPYRHYWNQYWGAVGIGGATMGSIQGATMQNNGMYSSNATLAPKGNSVTEVFDPQAAFYALGKAEAQLAA